VEIARAYPYLICIIAYIALRPDMMNAIGTSSMSDFDWALFADLVIFVLVTVVAIVAAIWHKDVMKKWKGEDHD